MALASLIPSSKTSAIVLALLPIAAPVAYLLYLDHRISPRVTASSGCRLPPSGVRQGPDSSDSTAPSLSRSPASSIAPDVHKPVSLPAEVASDQSSYILAYERVVSHPIPSTALIYPPPSLGGSPSALVTVYTRATMNAFSWTPQAFLIRSAISAPEGKRTFERAWIDGLGFNDGDVANGVYRVLYRGPTQSSRPGERIEIILAPPESYRGPIVHGLIVVCVEVVGDAADGDEKGHREPQVVFTNETWLWRTPTEKPILLESAIGRWLHRILAGWLVVKGIAAVTEKKAVI